MAPTKTEYPKQSQTLTVKSAYNLSTYTDTHLVNTSPKLRRNKTNICYPQATTLQPRHVQHNNYDDNCPGLVTVCDSQNQTKSQTSSATSTLRWSKNIKHQHLNHLQINSASSSSLILAAAEHERANLQLLMDTWSRPPSVPSYFPGKILATTSATGCTSCLSTTNAYLRGGFVPVPLPLPMEMIKIEQTEKFDSHSNSTLVCSTRSDEQNSRGHGLEKENLKLALTSTSNNTSKLMPAINSSHSSVYNSSSTKINLENAQYKSIKDENKNSIDNTKIQRLYMPCNEVEVEEQQKSEIRKFCNKNENSNIQKIEYRETKTKTELAEAEAETQKNAENVKNIKNEIKSEVAAENEIVVNIAENKKSLCTNLNNFPAEPPSIETRKRNTDRILLEEKRRQRQYSYERKEKSDNLDFHSYRQTQTENTINKTTTSTIKQNKNQNGFLSNLDNEIYKLELYTAELAKQRREEIKNLKTYNFVNKFNSIRRYRKPTRFSTNQNSRNQVKTNISIPSSIKHRCNHVNTNSNPLNLNSNNKNQLRNLSTAAIISSIKQPKQVTQPNQSKHSELDQVLDDLLNLQNLVNTWSDQASDRRNKKHVAKTTSQTDRYLNYTYSLRRQKMASSMSGQDNILKDENTPSQINGADRANGANEANNSSNANTNSSKQYPGYFLAKPYKVPLSSFSNKTQYQPSQNTDTLNVIDDQYTSNSSMISDSGVAILDGSTDAVCTTRSQSLEKVIDGDEHGIEHGNMSLNNSCIYSSDDKLLDGDDPEDHPGILPDQYLDIPKPFNGDISRIRSTTSFDENQENHEQEQKTSKKSSKTAINSLNLTLLNTPKSECLNICSKSEIISNNRVYDMTGESLSNDDQENYDMSEIRHAEEVEVDEENDDEEVNYSSLSKTIEKYIQSFSQDDNCAYNLETVHSAAKRLLRRRAFLNLTKILEQYDPKNARLNWSYFDDLACDEEDTSSSRFNFSNSCSISSGSVKDHHNLSIEGHGNNVSMQKPSYSRSSSARLPGMNNTHTNQLINSDYSSVSMSSNYSKQHKNSPSDSKHNKFSKFKTAAKTMKYFTKDRRKSMTTTLSPHSISYRPFDKHATPILLRKSTTEGDRDQNGSGPVSRQTHAAIQINSTRSASPKLANSMFKLQVPGSGGKSSEISEVSTFTFSNERKKESKFSTKLLFDNISHGMHEQSGSLFNNSLRVLREGFAKATYRSHRSCAVLSDVSSAYRTPPFPSPRSPTPPKRTLSTSNH